MMWKPGLWIAATGLILAVVGTAGCSAPDGNADALEDSAVDNALAEDALTVNGNASSDVLIDDMTMDNIHDSADAASDAMDSAAGGATEPSGGGGGGGGGMAGPRPTSKGDGGIDINEM